MNLYEHLEKTVTLIRTQKATLSLALADYQGEVPEYRLLNISQKVVSEFKQMLDDFLEKYAALHKNGDLRFIKFSADLIPDSHMVEYKKVKGTHFESVTSTIPDIADIPNFNHENDYKFLSKVKFYVIRIQFGSDYVFLFKRYTRQKSLDRSKGLLISLMGAHYEKVSDSAFSFDQTIDCLIIDNILFSFNKKNTEAIFRYFDELKQSAFDTIDSIAMHIPISNLDTFKLDCSTHMHKLGKLRNIAQKDYLKNLTIQKIKQIIERFKLPIQVVMKDGKEMLEHDVNNKWVLLNLLDDAYLSSDLTNLDYEVNSKLLL